MKKTAHLIKKFLEIPACNDIPAPLWCQVRDAPAETIYPQHEHAWGEFIYAYHGVLEVNVDSIHYLTPPPYGLWLPPHLKHSGLNRTKVTHCTVYIHESLCQHMPKHAGILLSSALVPAIMEHLKNNVVAQTDPDEHLRLLYVLLDQLQHAQIVGSYLPTTSHPLLQPLLDHLKQNPSDHHSLAELAQLVNTSERTLARYSQSELGMSLHEWRQRLRVMQALPLLEQGHTVESIALDLGYASATAFINLFKRWMGLTPDQFRKTFSTG